MTTYKTGVETVLLGGEMGGDEGKDIQRDAIYANEGVPPLADSCQCGRSILVESGNLFKGGGRAIVEVNTSFPGRTSRASPQRFFCHVRRGMGYTLQFLVESEDEL